MSYAIFSKQGILQPISTATVPMSKIEYAYGFGVYENVRVVHGTPLFLSDHIDRLFLSAEVIGLTHALTKENVDTWTRALIKEVGGDALNLKMLLIGGRTPEDAELSIIPLAPLFPEKKLFTKGASATLAHYERLFPNAKTLNMLGSFLAYREAKSAGAYDALLINRKNEITEGTRTNFFLIKDTTIISAPKNDILEGVTMKHMIEVAKKEGMTIRYEPITIESSAKDMKRRSTDLREADGAFLTSTSSKIMPLTKIGEIELTIPENLKKLMQAFDRFLDSTLARMQES